MFLRKFFDKAMSFGLNAFDKVLKSMIGVVVRLTSIIGGVTGSIVPEVGTVMFSFYITSAEL